MKTRQHLRAQQRIVARAKQLKWRIYDLRFYYHRPPATATLDGVITDQLWDSQFVQDPQLLKCSVVRLGRFPHAGDRVLPAVAPDLSVMSTMAADHFAERSFRQVGFVSYGTTYQNQLMREPFCKRAAVLDMESHTYTFPLLTEAQRCLTAEDKLIVRDEQLTQWLQRIPKPIGILGFSEGMAAGICTRSLEAGFRVPEDIAILSLGDDPLVCECSPVQISSIPRDGSDIADAAITLLSALMNGKKAPHSTVMVAPKDITVRESTDILATTSTDVAEAVRFMWAHIGESLSVADIAAAVDIPRRKLERGFRSQLGRGVNAELRRRRLEYCCELLRSTDLAVVDIAATIGISSVSYLHKVFRDTFGISPLKWRSSNARDTAAQH